MPELVPLAFGGGVVAVGLLLGGFEVAAGRSALDPAATDEDREFLRKRSKRRTRVAVMLTLIGVAIPLGDWFFEAREEPLLFGFYWLAVLLLVAWVVAIGLLDLAATRIHTRIQLRKLDRKKNELAGRLAAMRGEGDA